MPDVYVKTIDAVPYLIVIDHDANPLTPAVAVSTDGTDACCCDPPIEECAGCSGEYPPELTLAIDATGATENNMAVITGCSDADCEDLTGTYTLSSATPSGTYSSCIDDFPNPPVCITFDAADVCLWELPLSETSPTLPCVTSTIGGPIYLYFRVLVGEASDGDWYIIVTVGFSDDLPSGSGVEYHWRENLGSSKPTCLDIFPIDLTDLDYLSPIGGSETLTATCIYSSIPGITVDIP